MEKEKRKSMRRKSDLLVRKTIQLNRTLIDLLRVQRGDLGNDLNRIRALGLSLGRREQHREAAADYFSGQERITQVLIELGIIERLPRRVRLRKLQGAITYPFPLGTGIVGREYKHPRHSYRYLLYLDSGLRFRTSVVRDHCDDYLRTAYSLYRLEVLEEPYMGKTKLGVLESTYPGTFPNGRTPRRSAYDWLTRPSSPSISRPDHS
jgi:hypothetical protein